MALELKAPAFRDTVAILAMSKALIESEDDIVIDFANLGFATPKGMVLMAGVISNALNSQKIIKYKNYEHNSYAINVGFFRSIGLELDECKAKGGKTYIPIEKISVEEIIQIANQDNIEVGAVCERAAKTISALLTQESQSEQFKLLTYTIREIIRNSIEHGDSKYILVSGQYWQASGQVEISIYDDGMGLSKALSNNPNLKIDSDYTAIKYALLPGVSGKNYKGAILGKKTEWTNSGYGLYMTSQLVKKTGTFTICTGDQCLSFSSNSKELFSFNIQGTLVSISLNISKLSRVSPLLYTYAQNGKKIADLIGLSGEIDPSAASMHIF